MRFNDVYISLKVLSLLAAPIPCQQVKVGVRPTNCVVDVPRLHHSHDVYRGDVVCGQCCMLYITRTMPTVLKQCERRKDSCIPV